MPDIQIQENLQLLNGHGPKLLTSPEKHINGIAAPDSQHSTPTQSTNQDRPEGSAEHTAGRPATPELPNGTPLCTPRRLAAKSPSSGEAAGPTTPMQPPTATRRSDTSPPGRSAEEHLQPEKKPQEPVASPQHDTQKVQQRPAPGKRAPATAQQPSAARYLTSQYGQRNGRAHDGGRSFPQHEMQPMHNHNHSLHMQEEEQWHIDPEMSRDMEEWLWDGQQQDMQYYSPGQIYSQEYGHHQGMAWSGNSAGHMPPPPHHAHVPQPPNEPYPGGPHPHVAFHQGQPPPANIVLGYPATHPGAHYAQDGQQYMVGYSPKVEGWVNVPAVSHHDPMRPHDHYVPMHGTRYPQSMPAQMTPQNREYNAMWAEQQRRMQLAMMEQPAFVQGIHPMAFQHPVMVPNNVPMQHFSGGQGSDYGSSCHGQQRSGGAGHRASAPTRHQRQISLPDVEVAARAPAHPPQGRGKCTALPESFMRDNLARKPKPSHRRHSSLLCNEFTDRPPRPSHRRQTSDVLPRSSEDRAVCAHCAKPARLRGHRRQHSSPPGLSTLRPPKAPPERRQEGLPEPRGHRRHMSLPADLKLARQQGAFPGRRGHRRTQSSRAASMRSGGSSSSHSGRHSPAPVRQVDPAAPPPALTLQDVLKDLAKMCDTQDGSRQVQALLTSATPNEISAFVAGFVEHTQAMEVVTDSFGNYVAQRLLEAAGPEARLAIGRLLAPAMLDLSRHQYGCRVVQNAIQVLPTIESKVEMATALKGQVVACILNSHGNHVVQCCITHIPNAENGHSIEFMLQELRDATLKLSQEALGDKAAAVGEREESGFVGVAKHGYGCRVVQRIMEHCVLPGWKDQICRQVAEHACELAQTSFGNYVIQSCLALCSDEDRNITYANLMTQIGVLAFHKNASNVYEKLIGAPDARHMALQQLGAFFQRLLQDTGNRSEPGPLLDRLIPHQYGNYIINSCVVMMSREQLAIVKSRIEAELRAVEANPKSTKQVKDRVAKLLGKASACLEQAAAEATAGGK